jgi:hypothetical protein
MLLADDDVDVDLRARGLLLRPTGESETGIGPKTPFIVLRTYEPKPIGHALGNF